MIEINGKWIRPEAVLVVEERDVMGGSSLLMSSGDWITLDSSPDVVRAALGTELR